MSSIVWKCDADREGILVSYPTASHPLLSDSDIAPFAFKQSEPPQKSFVPRHAEIVCLAQERGVVSCVPQMGFAKAEHNTLMPFVFYPDSIAGVVSNAGPRPISLAFEKLLQGVKLVLNHHLCVKPSSAWNQGPGGQFPARYPEHAILPMTSDVKLGNGTTRILVDTRNGSRRLRLS